MNIKSVGEKCTGCFACKYVCPSNAIIKENSRDGFESPVIEAEKCTECGLCVLKCPVLNMDANNNHVKENAYIAYSKNSEIFKESSSGGVFSEIVYALSEDECYFATKWNEDLKAVNCIGEVKNLHQFQKSKYVQSDISNSFEAIEKCIEQYRQIYFVGTPCQVAAIKSIFGEDKVTYIELLCYGVPSPQLFQKYIKERFKYKIKDYMFRDGTSFIARAVKEDGSTVYDCNSYYTQGFLRNLYLRDCCYKCQFSSLSRTGDIVVGDAWNLKDGSSILIPVTNKGEFLISRLKRKLHWEEITIGEVIRTNSALVAKEKEDKSKEKFWEIYDENDLIGSIRKCIQNKV